MGDDECEQALPDNVERFAFGRLNDADDEPVQCDVDDHEEGEQRTVPKLLEGGVTFDRDKVHADQDDGHECKEDAIVLFDLEGGFFEGFHGTGIVSQLGFCAIVRADSVRKDSVRFPEGAMVVGEVGLYTVREVRSE